MAIENNTDDREKATAKQRAVVAFLAQTGIRPRALAQLTLADVIEHTKQALSWRRKPHDDGRMQVFRIKWTCCVGEPVIPYKGRRDAGSKWRNLTFVRPSKAGGSGAQALESPPAMRILQVSQDTRDVLGGDDGGC